MSTATPDLGLLRQPLTRDLVKQREGPRGSKLDYVEFGDVARILLDATGNHFDWQIVSQELFADDAGKAHWRTVGRLSIYECGSRDGIGTHPNVDGESPKASETDAFKRAATKFGVALDLYDKDKAYRNVSNAQPASSVQNGSNGSSGQAVTAQVQQPQQQPQSPQRREGNTATAVARNMEGNGQQYPGGIWPGPGQCPKCHAPEGKVHGRVCLQ